MKSGIAGLKRALCETTVAGTELKHATSPPENILDVRTTICINLIIHHRSLATGIDLEGI